MSDVRATTWRRQADNLEQRANALHARWELDGIGLRTALPADQAVELAELRTRATVLRECATEVDRLFTTLADTREANKKLWQQLTEVNSLLTPIREALRHVYATARSGQWNAACQRAWEALQNFREFQPK